MQKPEKTTFVIFFSVDRNAPNVRRYALLKQHLAIKSRPDIQIIDQAILANGTYQFIIVAEAESREVIETALEQCKGIINTQIVPVKNIFANRQAAERRYAVFIKNDPSKKAALIRNPDQLCAAVNLHLQAELDGETPYSSVLLVEAPSISKARQYGEYLSPQSYIFCTDAASPEAFMEKVDNGTNDTGQTINDQPILSPESVNRTEIFDSANDFTIVNQGSSTALIAPQVDYYDLFTNTKPLPPQASSTSNQGVYVWSSTSGQLDYIFEYTKSVNIPPEVKLFTEDKSISCNAIPPTLFSP